MIYTPGWGCIKGKQHSITDYNTFGVISLVCMYTCKGREWTNHVKSSVSNAPLLYMI
jgi:hypothetical protein